MKRVMIAIIALGHDAQAYESQCRPQGGNGEATLFASICSEDAPNCEPGLGTARGAQLGEHTWLTRDGMIRAGLRGFVDDLTLFYYFSDGHDAAPNVTSVEPTGGGTMLQRVNRPSTIPELAQLPDWSYAMHDFLTGNEHCPIAALRNDPASCHAPLHMGTVNSTHFAPQNRVAYAHYHAIAVAVARRCAAVAAAFPVTTDDPTLPVSVLTAYVHSDVVARCEREALAYESIGSHYLGDAWSEGHMWQRWGSPEFGVSSQGYCGAAAVSLDAGLIHGFRAGVEHRPFAASYRDDQLCMPGPYDPSATLDETAWPAEFVDEAGLVHAGGGDDYLLACNPSRNARNGWSVAGSSPLSFQYARALTCIAHGFREVYEQGPQTHGALSPEGWLDPAIATSLDGGCWNQRATNRSMYLGGGVSAWPASRNPLVAARIIPTAIALSAPEIALSCRETLYDSEEFRVAVTAYATLAEIYFHDAPDGTELADLDFPELQDFLGLQPNGAYVDRVEDAEYLESRDPSAWNPDRLPGPCSSDIECPPSMYCAVADTAGGRSCAPYETADLEAFRIAEPAAWCSHDTTDAMSAQAAACALYGGDACDACVRMVLPHVANACDAGSYAPRVHALDDADDRMLDHRSACHVLHDAAPALATASPALLYRPFDPDDAGAARAAALAFCQDGKPIAHDSFTYHFDDAWPAVPDGDFHDAPFVMTENTCGAGIGEQRRRFTHQAVAEDHPHLLVLRTQAIVGADGVEHRASVAELDVRLYQGPACNDEIAAGIAVNVDEDPEPDEIQLTWLVPANTATEICLRVKALRHTTWTAYRLAERISGCRTHLTISTGNASACAMRASTGQVYCWGNNYQGETGRGTFGTQESVPAPILAMGPASCLASASNSYHHCAIDTNNTVWCWGLGEYGELGDGGGPPFPAGYNAPVPVQVALPDVVDVATGWLTTCARQDTGAVWCWGDNRSGEIGTGTVGGVIGAPSRVTGVSGAAEIGITYQTSFARVGDDLVAWGNHSAWNGTTYVASAVPVSYPGYGTMVHVEGRPGGGCGLNSARELWCWKVLFAADPIELFLDHVVDFSLDGTKVCAVRTDGTVWCRGYAPLGDGTWTASVDAFVRVVGITTATEVATSDSANCVMLSSGEVWCWGNNTAGLLGNGDPPNLSSSTVPVRTLLPP